MNNLQNDANSENGASENLITYSEALKQLGIETEEEIIFIKDDIVDETNDDTYIEQNECESLNTEDEDTEYVECEAVQAKHDETFLDKLFKSSNHSGRIIRFAIPCLFAFTLLISNNYVIGDEPDIADKQVSEIVSEAITEEEDDDNDVIMNSTEETTEKVLTMYCPITTTTSTTAVTTTTTTTTTTTIATVATTIASTIATTVIVTNVVDESNAQEEVEETVDFNIAMESTDVTVASSSDTSYLVPCPLDNIDGGLNQYVYDLSNQYGVPYEFVLAVIRMESNFQTNAVSSANCIGLMQLMYRYNTDINLYDPYQNVTRGISLLSTCLQKSGGDLKGAYTYYGYGLYSNWTSYHPCASRVYGYYLEYLNK